MHNTTLLLIIAATSLMVGLGKGGIGAPLVIIGIPLLSLVMPVAQAHSTISPLLIIADVFALWFYRNTWDMRYLKALLPMSIVGTVLGTYLLAHLPDLTMRHILGILTLVFVAYRLLGNRIQELDYQPRAWHGHLLGLIAGLGSGLANSGAPPFTAYMLLQEVSPMTFVGTMTLYFAILNWIKLPSQISVGLLDFHDLVAIAWAVPLIPLGVWVGRMFIDRINREAFENFMLVVLALAGLVLIFITPPK